MAQNSGGWLGDLKLPFPKTRWALIGFVAGIFTWAYMTGHPRLNENTSTDDSTVANIDNTVRSVTQSIQDTSSTVRDRLTGVQNSVYNANLGTAVKDRLDHEKSIDAERIEVEAQDEGTVILKGLVPTEDDKEKAVDLARGTKGVTRVEDHLAVTPAPRVFAVKTDDDDAPRTRRVR